MRLRPFYVGLLVVILSCTPIASDLAAADRQEAGDAKKDELRTLLDADVAEMLNGNPQHILMFYQSVKEALAANKDNPLWKMYPFAETPSDPIMIAQFGEITLQGKSLPLSQATKEFIESDRQAALDIAIDLTQAEFSATARLAAEVIKQYRDDLSEQQWKKIVDGRQYIIRHRDKYPAGINTWADGYSYIPLGFVIFKPTEGRVLDSQTIYYVDGKQKYPNSAHGLGWRSDLGYVGFEKLSVGHHKFQLKTTYKFKLGEIEFTGMNESEQVEIEIIPAESPDSLAAVVDDKLAAEVEAAVVVGDETDGHEFTYSRASGDGKHKAFAKIWVPAIKVINPISVSLQMIPEIYIGDHEKPRTRYVLQIPAGKTTKRILENQIGDSVLSDLLKKNADAEGKVKAKLVLRPSHEHALSDPTVESYYPRAIEREIEFRWRPAE